MSAKRKVGAEPIGLRNGIPEPDGLQAVQLILRLRRERVSFRRIAAELEKAGHRTKRGGRWYASTVAAVWKRRARYLGLVAEAYDPPTVLVRGVHY